MTDHASLLKQIRADARPYVEQALDLAEVFTGFRKLASENGLDWGVIKQLIKAELQDEKEGGDEKVSRIIEKADFASAYADMLGLKMNENNFSSDASGTAGERGSRRQSASPLTQVGVATTTESPVERAWPGATLQSDSSDPVGRRVTPPAVSKAPPHDLSTGELIEEQNFDRSTGAAIVTTGDDGGQLSTDGSGNAVGKREQSEKVANERRLHCSSLAARVVQYPAGRGASSPAPISDVPANGPATAPAPGAEGEPLKGDVGETSDLAVTSASRASPINSETHRGPAKGEPSSEAASQGEASHAGTGSETLASLGANSEGEGASVLSPLISAMPDMPDFLKRSAA